MKTFKRTATALSIIAALGLSGCLNSSDDSESAEANTQPSAKVGPLVTKGVITGFGSVFVNGVEYETNAATIDKDGVPSDENGLQIGMVVSLSGEVNADGTTGTAASISFADEVEGPVLATTIAADGTGTLDVLGQTVTVTLDTIVESDLNTLTVLDATSIAVGNIVEVSGFSDGNGNIFATRIGVKKASHTAGEEIELKGLVSNLDIANSQFTLGGLTVNYTGVEYPAGIADGLYVEVKSDTAPTGNTLSATKVEVEGDGDLKMDAQEGEDVELVGVITSLDTLVQDSLSVGFSINGQPVILYAEEEAAKLAEEYEKLSPGAQVRVEGKMDADLVLKTKEVDVGQDDDLELKGFVDSVDPDAKTLTILGQTFYVDNFTVSKDDRENGVRYFSLENLVGGEWVQVKAYFDADSGKMIASKIKAEDYDSTDVEMLEGEIISNEGTTMVIGNPDLGVGITVDYTSISTPNLTALVAGDEVEMVVTESGGLLTATKISLN